MRDAIQLTMLLLTSATFASSFGPLITTFRPIEASAVQGSLEVVEESTGLFAYASINAGPTGTYALTLTDGHCDPLFAQAKSRPDFLGQGKVLADLMMLRFERQPVGMRAEIRLKPDAPNSMTALASLHSKTVIVERLEPGGRVLSACGQLWANGNATWAENKKLEHETASLEVL
jgi:hypothetical protein